MGQDSGSGGVLFERYKPLWGHFMKKDMQEKLMKFSSERFKQLFHGALPARRLPVIIHSSELVNDL